MMSPNNNPDIIIIGGGFAGLSAALHLAERGLKPLVLEADPNYLGGRVAGREVVELDGWQFRGEHGVHAIWSPYLNFQAMLARHNIRPMFVPALEEAWIYKRGPRVKKAPVGTAIRYSPLQAPLHYLNLFVRPRFLRMLQFRDWLSLISVWGGLMWGVGVDPLAENQPLGDLTLHDLTKHWAPAVRAFLIGLARNGLSATPDEIPLSGFIAFLRFYTLLRRDSWIFSYMPADGGTSLIDPLSGKIKELGGDFQQGCEVTHIEKKKSLWSINYVENGSHKQTLSTNVILAADAPNTAKIIDASPDLPNRNNLFWPRGMGTAAVRVWFNTSPKPCPEGGIFSGDFVIDNYFWLHIIQDQYRQWHKATGGSAIEVHIYGPPELLVEPDALLISKAIADIQSAFPELRGHRIHQTLERNPNTHTLFSIGPKEDHLGIETPWQGIYCCGDWVRDPAPAFFLERACLTGILAANAILNIKNLKTWPTLSYPKPEPFAGFIEKLMKRGRQKRKQKNT